MNYQIEKVILMIINGFFERRIEVYIQINRFNCEHQ
jgi:hypothetical protein